MSVLCEEGEDVKIRQARKIVRRTLKCFDYWPRYAKPGYTIDQTYRAALRMRRYRRHPSKYERYILECAIAFIAEQK